MTRKVAVFFLGGTIAMAQGASTTGVPGVAPRLSAGDLLGSVPQLNDLDVDVDAHDFRRVPSPGLTFSDIAELVQRAADMDRDGVVVVQGTDTIEETAYLIDLLWQVDTPIIVTGAMRNPSLAGADGPANLLAAVRVAADRECRGMGSLVVINDEIHAARSVRKMHTTNLSAFASPNTGPIGMLVEGVPMVVHRPCRVPMPVLRAPLDARVGLYTVSFDDDGALLSGVIGSYDGLVVAGLGGGHVPPALIEPLTKIAARLSVVLASRTNSGPVLTNTYAYPGAEIDLLSRGLIGSRFLDPYKARVLLRVALATGCDRDEIRDTINRAAGAR